MRIIVSVYELTAWKLIHSSIFTLSAVTWLGYVSRSRHYQFFFALGDGSFKVRTRCNNGVILSPPTMMRFCVIKLM